jgi:hypothetical protein
LGNILSLQKQFDVYWRPGRENIGDCQSVNKKSILAFDALPMTGTPITTEDPPIHPTIGEMWRCLFDKDEETPL